MSSLNKVLIIGNLGADPEVRYTQSSTAVANFSVATTERYKDAKGEQQESTEWHRIVLWGRQAEVAQQYLKKGDRVCIEGPLQTREWEDKEGVKRYTTEIKGLKLLMLSGPKEGSGAGRPPEPPPPGQASAPAAEPASEFDDMDDDLPF